MPARSTADARRKEVLRAAVEEFAIGGPGTTTHAIARRVGISQPYLFRLYDSKHDIFVAAVEQCFADIREVFERAGVGLTGDAAAASLGDAYADLIEADPATLRMQLQAYTASAEDPEVRAATMRGYSRVWDTVVTITGMSDEQARAFFAEGMLMNVIAALRLSPDGPEPLARRLTGPRRPGGSDPSAACG